MTLLFRYFPGVALSTALAILTILPIFGWAAGVPMSYLTRDPAQLGSLRPYAGVISNLGVLAWAGGFFVAAFTATMLDLQRSRPDAVAYLQVVALWTMILCADDFFILHESLPIPEEFLFAAYAVGLAFILIHYRGVVQASPFRLAVVAVLLLAGSLTIDFFQEYLEPILGDLRILAEDGAKLLGAVAWLGYIWQSALAFSTASPATEPRARHDPTSGTNELIDRGSIDR